MLKTNESAENYLETILVLSQKKPVVRGVDIAEELGFKKSSVSVAMKNLREKEQIRVTPEGYIYLTDSGRAIAEMIYERHQLLSRGLMSLGVDEQTATEDACRIEHVISQESFEAIKRHLHMTAEKWETFGFSFYSIKVYVPLPSSTISAGSSVFLNRVAVVLTGIVT